MACRKRTSLLAITGTPRKPAACSANWLNASLALAPGAGQLQVQTVAEDALPIGQLLFGQVMPVLAEQPPDQAFAAGEGEQVVVMIGQPLRPDRHAAFGAMALHPGSGEQARRGSG